MNNISTESQELDAAERTYARGRATKAHILDVAMATFAENGYRGSSLRDLASRAGMSHPGLLYHFPTKEDLLMSVLARRDELDAEVNPVRGEDGIVAMRNLARASMVNEDRPGVVELFAVVSAEATSPAHPAHDYFVERYRTLVATLTQAYEVAAKAGQVIDGLDPTAAAQAAIAVVDGLQVQWLLGLRDVRMSEVVRRHFQAHLTVPLDLAD
ncbi:TetR/AcrR family transcriptional regulator [Demequina globuliformis]|uniref:TetR/AcrR family transcriptional regulator n=1 Tax=Demequina globuliformis TaxID=676202 RepID=UPI001F35BB92|nr:TetR/AcrR family transcriptional regulator [Demequina globuliformis]